MKDEIILTPYQANIFASAEMLLRTQGYLGESLFEDTYVLSKKLAEYIVANVPANGSNASSYPTKAYNAVLGIGPRVTIAGMNTNVSPAVTAALQNVQLDPTIGDSAVAAFNPAGNKPPPKKPTATSSTGPSNN